MVAFDTTTIIAFFLVLLRISALLFALPFFGDQIVPVQVRILCAVALALAIFPLMPSPWGEGLELGVLGCVGLMLRELLIGLVLGYSAKFLFEGVIMAANLVGYQMGFGMANLLLPGSDMQVSAFTALHRIIVLLFFLTLGLHYIFIHALWESFRLIPAGSSVLTPALGQNLVQASIDLFKVAVQLSAPILVALLFTMAALGLIARTVPQLNVFTLSFPLSFFVGLGVYMAMTPFLPAWLSEHFHREGLAFLNIVHKLRP